MESTGTSWHGPWDELVAKARETWSELTDEDLSVVDGNFEELVARIGERTGETAEAIVERLAANG